MQKIAVTILGLAIGVLTMTTVVEASRETKEHPVLVAQLDAPADAADAPVEPAPSGPAASEGSSAGSGSATTPTKPSDALANPVDDPLEAINDARQAFKQGWAVGLLAIVVMLTAGLARAGQKWPTAKPLAWIAKKKWALLAISGAGLVGAAAYNALALGGSPYAALLAAGGAVLALVMPKAGEAS